MINIKNKKAFSMITAIFVIVIMASLTALIMNISGKTIKATTLQYQKEQAGLLARSYTELAILYVIHYDRTTTPNCLETITDHFGETGDNGYDIRVNIKYIGNDNLLNGCNKTILADGTVGLASLNNATWTDEITGFDKTISLVIDTFITYKDFDDPANRDITYHRRTLQKL
jgi:type II secretory pathway pseudopilin PulG